MRVNRTMEIKITKTSSTVKIFDHTRVILKMMVSNHPKSKAQTKKKN